MPKVSVIIPVYGVEPYIERCARSLFEQTLDDMEYIFVNDCTPDRSVEILAEIVSDYPNRINQVKMVNMDHNSGQAAVRRKGIEMASGEYVIHCDSDDFVARDMYKLLYETAVSLNYDIVTCDYYELIGNESAHHATRISDDLFSDILMMPVGGSLCNKMVRREIVQDSSIVYPTYNVAEDLVLSSQYSLLSSSDCHVSQALYNYCRRPSSIIGNHSFINVIENNKQHQQNFDIVISVISSHKLLETYASQILHHKLNIKNAYLQLMSRENVTKLWRSTYRDINLPVLFSKVVTFKEKLSFILAMSGLYPLYIKYFKQIPS